MKPQKELNRHRPEEGIYGDCPRTERPKGQHGTVPNPSDCV